MDAPLIYFWIAFLYGLSVWAAFHALLRKRDPRSALGWIVVCLAFPGLGAVLYRLLGINRIRLRAKSLNLPRQPGPTEQELEGGGARVPAIHPLDHLSGLLTRQPLMPGCRLEMLINGEEAYPAMLEAIRHARESVFLSSFIFDNDEVGLEFVEALAAAKKRGVDVHVIVDGIGALYSFPSITRPLRANGIPTARFLPPSLTRWGVHFNLRNHRKILTVDGQVGFTGGMNIGARHVMDRQTKRHRAADTHFRVTGPIVGQMEEVFVKDWGFTSGNPIQASKRAAPASGSARCRGIAAGPNEDFEKLRLIYLGALTGAKTHVRIMTPYFIPDTAFISAINTAVLKGVKVEIILPEVNNLFYIHWATRAYLWEILKYGAHVFYQPAPFNHSKFLTLDGEYSLIGSANLDPRSLRLNFEFNLEVFDAGFASDLSRRFDAVKGASHAVSLAEMDRRNPLAKTRDAMAKLLSPYL